MQWGKRTKGAWLITGGNHEVRATDRSHLKVGNRWWGPQFCRTLSDGVPDWHRSLGVLRLRVRCFVLQFPSQSGQEDLQRVAKTRWGQATGAEEVKNGGQAAGWESGGIINVGTEVSHVVTGADTRRRSPMNEGRGPEARTEPGG